ncbi:hypothetical protein [Actinomadura verrucosospora]|uniref:Secreted protein n=1 Tax=Actinomadura verrucosospora TaxID=46165 RepID=A0A7D3VT35_ACTVE|nr:hypothetical protein [Actinomadura verrucosospora]QKG21979.1 hypothetical protein ACTIVE_3617 [Actinomadura verrucosospora]
MRTALARRTAPLALAAAVAGTLTGAGLTGTALADAPSGAWTATEITGLTAPALYGVTAPGRERAWAVGTQSSASAPLILSYRHGAWTPQAAPAGTAPVLVDVASGGPSNVWAVGQGGGDATAKSLHWNGRAWKAVAYPRTQPMAVSVDSRGKAWSVGSNTDGSGAGVFRRTGGTWTDKGLALTGGGMLDALAARTPKDVWAGGLGSSGDGLWHYDGTAWTQMDIPGDWPHWVLQIVALSPKDVWFYTLPQDPLFSGPDLVHWDGTAFTVTKTPSPYGQVRTFAQDVGFLGDIASDGRGGVWLQDSRTAYYRHFDGTAWTDVPRPGGGTGGAPQVYDLAQAGRTASVWGVGPGAGDRLLIDRFR